MALEPVRVSWASSEIGLGLVYPGRALVKYQPYAAAPTMMCTAYPPLKRMSPVGWLVAQEPAPPLDPFAEARLLYNEGESANSYDNAFFHFGKVSH